MSLEEREYISILIAKGENLRSIGKELGRNHSSARHITVGRRAL